MDPNTAAMLRTRNVQLAARMMAVEQSLKEAQKVKRTFGVARVEDSPGRKKPFIFPVQFPLVVGSVQPVPRTVSISQTGPFVCTALAAQWLITANGRFRPISSVVDNEQNPPVVNGVNFVYEITTAGSGWRWQQEPIPSSMLYSNYDRPKYLEVPEYIEPNEALFITITPIVAPAATGTLYFDLIGFRIFDTSRYVR